MDTCGRQVELQGPFCRTHLFPYVAGGQGAVRYIGDALEEGLSERYGSWGLALRQKKRSSKTLWGQAKVRVRVERNPTPTPNVVGSGQG